LAYEMGKEMNMQEYQIFELALISGLLAAIWVTLNQILRELKVVRKMRK
jgi:hypothetical protein